MTGEIVVSISRHAVNMVSDLALVKEMIVHRSWFGGG